MEKYTFGGMKEKVLHWSRKDILNLLSDSDSIKLVKNEKDVLIIDMTFKQCLAQLIVSRQNFTPYKYISFEAMIIDSKNMQPKLIYFFYDSPDTFEYEVMDELNLGVKFLSNYIPSKIEDAYIGKSGNLDIGNEKLRRIIHPDDCKKIDKNLLKGKFICTGIQFQYLIVQNNLISLRILPRIFIEK